MKFNSGDYVAWDHVTSSIHGSSSIIKKSALPAAEFGTVTRGANDEGTWYEVLFENGDSKVLTFEEIVKVEVD